MNEYLNLKEILQLLGQRWRVIVSIVLLITLCGGFSSYAIPPAFEAKIDLLINNSTKEDESTQLDTFEIDMNLRLIETYKYILKSDRMMSNVNGRLKEQYTNAELTKKIKIESNNNSQIITIIAYESTPKKAAQLVNTYATTFQQEIKQLMNLENIKILKDVLAEIDTKKVKPNNIFYFIVSFVFGFLICVFVIIGKEIYFTKMDSVKKTERAMGITNLGSIPFITERPMSRKWNNELQGRLFTNLDFPDYVIEEYRRVRENLEFIMKGQNVKTILVTSSDPGDGKSTVSGNLSIIMGMNGKKTVYIDADLRKSTGRLLFNLPNRKGLTSAIAGHDTLDNIIQKTAIENVFFISAGPFPPNPTKFLASSQIKNLLEELKERFEVIIIDSPPLVVADAVTLSSIVDGCLFIVDAKSTKEETALKSLAQLTKVNAPLLGFILNRTDSSKYESFY